MLYKKLTENELYNNLKQISMADFLQKQTIMCCLLYNHFCWLLILKKHHFESNKTYIVPRFIVFLFYSLAILWSNFGYVEHPLNRTLFFGLVAVPLIGSQLYVIDKLSLTVIRSISDFTLIEIEIKHRIQSQKTSSK